MSGVTIFRCSHCGKELSQNNRWHCERFDETRCVECIHLANLGIKTIQQYNDYLRLSQKRLEAERKIV